MRICRCGCGSIPKGKNSKYCRGHNARYFSKPIIRLNCKVCGGEFFSKNPKKQFCSKKCYFSTFSGKGNPAYGKKRPDLIEYNKLPEVREIRRRHALSENPSKKPEVRKKLSKTRLENGLSKGEKNPNWRGGKSWVLYGEEFNIDLREQIRKRDNYQCQECGYFQGNLSEKLSIHHIDYNKKNNDPLNLISLCKSCHSQTNFAREDWIRYFKENMSVRKEVVGN